MTDPPENTSGAAHAHIQDTIISARDDIQYECYITESADGIRARMPPVCVVVRLVRARQGSKQEIF